VVEVGLGQLAVEDAIALLDHESPLPARLTAPASGLFLERVYYPGDPRDQPVHPAVVLTQVSAR
jgi:tRNA U38,U39,U40 pseudouridine synthase TruA